MTKNMTPKELEKFLEKHGLTYQEFAELLGVTKPAVDHWRSGRRSVPPTIVKLCRFFDREPMAMARFQ